MASKNEVTLTFAGDTKKLETAFDKVGGASKTMSDKVGAASKAVEDHGGSLGRLGEKADNSERNLIGVHDVIDGTATIMQGPGKAGITAYVQGWADLAGGIAPLLVSLSEVGLTTIRNTVAMVAHAAWTGLLKIGTLAWAAAQWVLNAAMNANPIGLIVIGIIALIAIIELVVHNTKFFKDIWNDVWGFMKGVAHWFAHDFVDFFKNAWKGILDFGEGALKWFKDLPGNIGRALAKIADFLLSPFKGAFNAIADAWNNTVGKLSFHIPDWVPGLGGKGFSVPQLPHFHTGGVVPGAPGSEMLAILQAGERVIPAGQSGAVTVSPVFQVILSAKDEALAALLGLVDVHIESTNQLTAAAATGGVRP